VNLSSDRSFDEEDDTARMKRELAELKDASYEKTGAWVYCPPEDYDAKTGACRKPVGQPKIRHIGPNVRPAGVPEPPETARLK
jgi:hypothetical protein